MKFGSAFVFENNKDRLSEFDFNNYSTSELLTCNHLNIAEIENLFKDYTTDYALTPPVFQGDSMLILEISTTSLKYLFEHKNFFEELYQDDLLALEKFHSTRKQCNLFEVATW